MKFTTFAVVATFLSFVVANPLSDNVGREEESANGCKGQWCYNSRTGLGAKCCKGSSCNYGVSINSYCT